MSLLCGTYVASYLSEQFGRLIIDVVYRRLQTVYQTVTKQLCRLL